MRPAALEPQSGRSQVGSEADRRDDGQAGEIGLLGGVEVIENAAWIQAVVDVLNIEIAGQDPAVEDPLLVDSQIELVEGGQANAVDVGRLDPGVGVGLFVPDRGDQWRLGISRCQTPTGSDLPVGRQLVGAQRRQDMSLVPAEQPGLSAGLVDTLCSCQGVADPV